MYTIFFFFFVICALPSEKPLEAHLSSLLFVAFIKSCRRVDVIEDDLLKLLGVVLS